MPRYLGTTNTALLSAGGGFTAGNQSADSLYAFMSSIGGIQGNAKAAYSVNDVYDNILNSVWSAAYFDPVFTTVATPTAGGTMTVNGQSVASYDFVAKNGNQTISSYNNANWFTGTNDTRSALIYVNGNLTINAGQTLIPSQRKLFTAIYVNGNLTINGAISMSNVGSNHNGTGNSSGAVREAVAVKMRPKEVALAVMGGQTAWAVVVVAAVSPEVVGRNQAHSRLLAVVLQSVA